VKVERYSGAQVNPVIRSFCQACERCPGEISGQVFTGKPWKGETQGSSQ
jgi:hypothetical protein